MAKIHASIIEDSFDFYNAKGKLVKKIPYKINLTQIEKEATQKRLLLAQKSLQNDAQSVGEAFIELLLSVFGESVTDQLIDYYGGRDNGDYIAMVYDLAPVLTEEIYPKLDAIRSRAMDLLKATKKHA